MEDKVADLFSELNQIFEQYKREVPGGRRAWPKSIKERIFALQSAGVNAHQIAQQVPVPYMTIVSWNSKSKKKGKFLPVSVVKEVRPPTVTVGGRRKHRKFEVEAPTTVTVVTPEGLRIEGLPLEVAKSLLGVGR